VSTDCCGDLLLICRLGSSQIPRRTWQAHQLHSVGQLIPTDWPQAFTSSTALLPVTGWQQATKISLGTPIRMPVPTSADWAVARRIIFGLSPPTARAPP